MRTFVASAWRRSPPRSSSSSASGGCGRPRGHPQLEAALLGRLEAWLKLDDGKIETEFEVDQNERRALARRPQARRQALSGDIRTTHAPSGSFSVERKTKNTAGPNRIKARAVFRTAARCGRGDDLETRGSGR